jgi:acylglycerol lipase
MTAARATLTGLSLALTMAACAPILKPPGAIVGEPVLEAERLITADGAALPVRSWLPAEGKPNTVIVALHGFNDYGKAFEAPAAFLAEQGIATYAPDQRGFGEAPNPGFWPGIPALVDDLRTLVDLVRRRHPGLPLYILGDSMGGAVTMVAMSGANPPPADGVVLVAPAVWGRKTMPWYQTAALWVVSHTMPWFKASGKHLNIKASDNIEMLRALGRDPLVIKETRADAMYGLVNLMDAALEASATFDSPALIQYGGLDEVVPREPTFMMFRHLPQRAAKRQRLALYDDGYHMLLRDLGARGVWKDIAAWIEDAHQPLPSGADARARALLSAEDPGS